MLNTIRQLFREHHRILFYLTWFLVHIVQASCTELFDDEAYYWIYSRFPDWGYFDHPPVISILIRAGYALFQNELGVRIFIILLSTASIYLIDSLTEKKNPFLFYAICLSIALAQLGGMMAVPDTPLMFFVALFFWLYRRFIGNINFINSLLLGVCIALMLYTKYHGVLVVLFTVLSNPALLRKHQSYIVFLVALLLFIPHIYWQHINGYPSVQFHLFERNEDEYKIKVTLEFILGQILIAGPIAGWLLILSALRKKPESLTERALKFTFVGIYVFFLLSTFKGRAEANWTIPSFIGMIVLSHQYLTTQVKWKRWLYKSVPVTLLLVFALRAIMMIDMPPKWWLAKDEVHQNKVWVNEIQKSAGTLPVVFPNTYQRPSKYWFYGNDTAFSLNSPYYRRNNFNFWNIEDSLIGKPVYVVNLGIIPKYYSFSKVQMTDVSAKQIAPRNITVRFRSKTPEHYLHHFQDPSFRDAQIFLAVYRKKEVVGMYMSGITVKDITKRFQENLGTFTTDSLPPGRYSGKLTIESAVTGHPSINSSAFPLNIK